MTWKWTRVHWRDRCARTQIFKMASYKTCGLLVVTLSLCLQMKELKSRVADMEGQPRPSAGITLLETKIQELEEKLHSEERYD